MCYGASLNKSIPVEKTAHRLFFKFATGDRRIQGENGRLQDVDEGRKRVIGIMAAILTSLHMRTADDPFGGPQGSPHSNTEIRWAKE
jgi:hypothetical protein